MHAVLLLVVLMCLAIGSWMLLRPERFLQAKRERAPLFKQLTAQLNQPSALNLTMLRISGAVLLGVGALIALLLISH